MFCCSCICICVFYVVSGVSVFVVVVGCVCVCCVSHMCFMWWLVYLDVCVKSVVVVGCGLFV